MSQLPVTLVLPCHSLEDFPTHLVGKDASSLLAGWTTAWHPMLILANQQLKESSERQTSEPLSWVRPDQLGELSLRRQFLVPTVAIEELPFGIQRQIEAAGGRLLSGFTDRQPLVDQIFADEALSAELNDRANLFFSLGYVYLQVQLMTRQLRGTSNLDGEQFCSELLSAARACIDDDEELMGQHLQRCFDRLVEEKNNYYPVPCSFIDLVLVSQQTTGRSLAAQLGATCSNNGQASHPQNWLLTTEVLKHLAATKSWWSELKLAAEKEQVSFVGSLTDELPFRLLPPESLARSLLAYHKDLKCLGLEGHPGGTQFGGSVFAQRLPGLTGQYPRILESAGCVGALHMRFEPVSFPHSSGTTIRWEGENGGAVTALTRDPQDANRGEAFLRLGIDIGEQIDSAHLATLVFAHWPNQFHFAFRDLLNSQRFGSLFGRFMSLPEYFDEVYDPGFGDTYTSCEYGFNALKRALKRKQTDPVSRVRRTWHLLLQLGQLESMLVQSVLAKTTAAPIEQEFLNEIHQLQVDVDRLAAANDREQGKLLENQVQQFTTKLFQYWGLQDVSSPTAAPLNLECSEQDGLDRANGGANGGASRFLVNLGGAKHRMRCGLDVPSKSVAIDPGRVAIEGRGFQNRQGTSPNADDPWIGVVDVPGYCVSRICESDVSRGDGKQKNRSPDLVEGRYLRNEFFEVEIDEQRGGIRGLNLYQRRNNLLSQRLALRVPAELDAYGQPLTSASYSEMVCESMTTSVNNSVMGEVLTQGSLILEGETVARFLQRVRVTRGVPIVALDIEIEPLATLQSHAGNYFCSRLAWKHDSEDVISNTHGSKIFASGQWLESPLFFEIQDAKRRLTLLTGGLPYHRRSSPRILDSILIPDGESARHFRLGLGVDLPYGELAARDLICPPVRHVSKVGEASGSAREPSHGLSLQSSLHFNARNIIVNYWNWVLDPEGGIVGAMVRIREFQGRSGTLKISCRHPIRSASHTNLQGQHIHELEIESNAAMFNYEPFDFAEIHLNWNS